MSFEDISDSIDEDFLTFSSESVRLDTLDLA